MKSFALLLALASLATHGDSHAAPLTSRASPVPQW